MSNFIEKTGMTEIPYQLICPHCKETYNHFKGKVDIKNGNDNYEANKKVRGDVVTIPIDCECGHHSWELNIGFHKGMIYLFI